MTTGTRDLEKELEALGKRTKGLLDYAMEKALTEPVYLTEADLVDEDFHLPDAWRLKLTPSVEDELGWTQTLITPEGEEVLFEDVFDVEGVWMTRAQMEAQQVALRPEVPELVAPEVFATPDEELLYKEYMRTGGTFDVETWTMIGGPIRPSDTDIETLLDKILEIGRTPENEALLRRLAPTATDEDIDEFFGTVPIVPPSLLTIPGVQTLEDRIDMMRLAGIQEDEIKKLIESSGIDLTSVHLQEGWWKDRLISELGKDQVL